MSAEGRELLRSSISRSGIPLIEAVPISKSIEQGFALFRKAAGGNRISLYINIGGGLASLGTSEAGRILRPGLNEPRLLLKLKQEPVQGYTARFMAEGLRVLNIQDIVSLALANHLPVAPGVTPAAGEGDLFVTKRYNLIVIVPLLIVFCCIVLAFAYGLTDVILKNPRKEML